MTLLVIGATGTLGRQIVFQALTKGYPVKCGVREVDPNGWLVRAPEVEIVYLDLRFPDTLPEALKNVTVIIDASTLRAEEELGTLKQIDLITKIALIKAAKKANIQRFIFLSIANKPINFKQVPLLNFKNSVELCLKQSQVPYTIYQLPSFFQGLVGQYAVPILDEEAVWVSDQESALSYLDAVDIAKLCLHGLTQESQLNKTIVLESATCWFASEIITLCEQYSGQTAEINVIPVSSLEVSRKLASFFMWSWGIHDRLTFSSVSGSNTSSKDLIIHSSPITYIHPNGKLDVYLRAYYSLMLKILSDLKYDQKKVNQRKDLTF